MILRNARSNDEIRHWNSLVQNFVGNYDKRILKITQNFCAIFLWNIEKSFGDRDSTVVKVLCYKSEGRWFDPSWCHWNFLLT